MSIRQLASTWLVGLSLGVAAAGIAELDPARVRWETLDFRASKLAITATSAVSVETVPAERARQQWLKPDNGTPIMPRDRDVVHVRLGSLLLGKRSQLDLWLDPATGAAIQRTQLETGRKVRHNRHRSLRFMESGVLNSTYRASKETVDQPFGNWDLTEELEKFPPELNLGAVVTEPSALFYLLAVSDLDEDGDRLTTYVSSKRRVMRVQMTVVETTRIKVDYTVVSSDGERGVSGRQEVLRIRLDGSPVGAEGKDQDFEFLGLRGDVEVFLDPFLRMPVQISGHIRYMGKGHVRLQRVTATR